MSAIVVGLLRPDAYDYLDEMGGRVTNLEASSRVSLREITSDNLRAVLGLSVTDQQNAVYPRSNAWSIAEGHYPSDDDLVWIRAIYAVGRHRRSHRLRIGSPIRSASRTPRPAGSGEDGQELLWRMTRSRVAIRA